VLERYGTVLVERQALFREGLGRILASAGFQIICSADSVDDSILRVLSCHQSLLLVIGADGDLEAVTSQIGLFRERQRTGRIVVLADNCGFDDVRSALQAGANAFLTKIASCDVFIKSLELVMLGETIVPSEILPLILDQEEEDLIHRGGPDGVHVRKQIESDGPFRLFADSGGIAAPRLSSGAPRLSSQEQRVLHCLMAGDANKVIARKLHVAEATVKVHVKAILRKTGAHNRTEAAVWATNNCAAL
jgi:DNA-binding NarL/FixJ family response regulator